VSDDGGSDKRGWSPLGFLYCVLGNGPRFWRLIALLMVLIAAYALAKGDVTAVYDHLTQHAPGWAKWGIPPVGAGTVLSTMKFLGYRSEARRRRAAEVKEATKELPGNRGVAEPVPKKAANQRNDPLGEPGGDHAKNHRDPDPGPDSRPADDAR
jgi:hypothetical protein